MGVFGGTPPSCPSSRHCEEWARTYLKYCLCSQKDSAALALGLLSVISWGVAEVPQIITNYRQKSTEGLSVAFLMTWIVGYVCCFTCFLLLGCVIAFMIIIVVVLRCYARYLIILSLLLFYLYRDLFNLIGCFLEPATVRSITLTFFEPSLTIT
jgi:uncharacterized protein with PQ loop repeat